MTPCLLAGLFLLPPLAAVGQSRPFLVSSAVRVPLFSGLSSPASPADLHVTRTPTSCLKLLRLLMLRRRARCIWRSSIPPGKTRPPSAPSSRNALPASSTSTSCPGFSASGCLLSLTAATLAMPELMASRRISIWTPTSSTSLSQSSTSLTSSMMFPATLSSNASRPDTTFQVSSQSGA